MSRLRPTCCVLSLAAAAAVVPLAILFIGAAAHVHGLSDPHHHHSPAELQLAFEGQHGLLPAIPLIVLGLLPRSGVVAAPPVPAPAPRPRRRLRPRAPPHLLHAN